MTDPVRQSDDGAVVAENRLADLLAIQDLATSYAYAVDDRDWKRWERLFLPDAFIDYTEAGGIAGLPSGVATWMSDAMTTFTFCMHLTSTHEIRFVSDVEATGRVQVFNRNGAMWQGQSEIVDVGAIYEDVYRRVGDCWRFARRVEHTQYIVGGGFADFIREAAQSRRADRTGERLGPD